MKVPTLINLESRIVYKSKREIIYHVVPKKHSYTTRMTCIVLRIYQVGS